MTDKKDQEPVEKGKALTAGEQAGQAKDRDQQPAANNTDIKWRAKVSRAHTFAFLSVVFAALAVVGGFFLWKEMNQLQKYAYADGGLQDIGQFKADVKDVREQLSGLRMRLDDLAGVENELGRTANTLSDVKGQFKELRSHVNDSMEQIKNDTTAKIDDKLTSLEDQLTTNQTKLEQTQGAVNEIRDQVTSRLAQMQNEQTAFRNNIEETVSTVEKALMRTQTQRVLAEVEHYLKVAQNRITIEQEIRAAENALRAASDRLQELQGSKYQSLKTMIKDDLEKLQAIQQPDIAGIATRLSQLQATVDKLPIKGMERSFTIEGGSIEGGDDGGMWQKAWSSVKQGLNKVVEVRRQGEPVMPLLSPEHSFFLYQNMRLKLETARMALIKRDQAVYRESLEKTEAWARKYLAATKASQKMFTALQSLVSVNINPDLPSFEKSLQLLRDEHMITVSAAEAAQP